MKRLTEEARASFEESKNEERQRIKTVVIDPTSHPDLAYDQLRLLVLQMKMLTQASGGADQLQKQVNPYHEDAELTLQVLKTLQHHEQSGSKP
ncbi:MAG: hypothetical protein QM527_07065 [Alphaproteobacteria bacterium]|nr:hypothetical protein [Alphaproteobacteria bacterium]